MLLVSLALLAPRHDTTISRTYIQIFYAARRGGNFSEIRHASGKREAQPLLDTLTRMRLHAYMETYSHFLDPLLAKLDLDTTQRSLAPPESSRGRGKYRKSLGRENVIRGKGIDAWIRSPIGQSFRLRLLHCWTLSLLGWFSCFDKWELTLSRYTKAFLCQTFL
jgi:hypothetical protein